MALGFYPLSSDSIAGPGVASYSLAVSAGSFAETGQSVNLTTTRTLPISTGAFTETGQSVALEKGFRSPISVGSFSETGQSVNLIASRTLLVAAGTYTLNGQSVSLVYSASGTPTLRADVGIFGFVGPPNGLVAVRYLSAGTTAYSLAGLGITFELGAITPPVDIYVRTTTSSITVLTNEDVQVVHTALDTNKTFTQEAIVYASVQ